MAMRKELSIIIVNYRSWPYLRDCLKSLEPLPDRYGVLIVDNSSDDGQFESFAANYPHIEFVKSPYNLGFGGGCRLGALRSNAEYLLFLNPDTLANYEAIESMLKFLQCQDTYGIVSCRQHDNVARHHLLFPNFFRLCGLLRGVETRIRARRFSIQRWRGFEFIVPDWVSASVLMVSSRDYEKIGGWNERLWMYYEDPDLCRRFANQGGRVALLTSCRIGHKHGGSTRLDMQTTAFTKAEVTISRHVYIHDHFSNTEQLLSHTVLIIGFLLFGSLLAFLGVLTFFIPKMRLHSMIWQRRCKYYAKVFRTRSWLSPRLGTHA
jgi:GT2 family glycosyltransferase